MSASDPDGSIQSWSLDIDNDGTAEYSGQGSPQATKQHIYQSVGTYTANLIVTDNDGATDSDNETITVTGGTQNQNPSCSLLAAPNSGPAPLTVTFTMSASDSDGSIMSWSLDVDNDTTPEYSGQGNPPTSRQHIYQAAGTYIANLTVIDNEGGTDTDAKSITVTVNIQNQRPSATLSTTLNTGPAPLNVTFAMTASDPDGSIQSWSLDIDDDGVSEYSGIGGPPASLQHTYQANGTYVANLTVTDDGGATDSDLETITVTSIAQNQRPTCSITASPNSGFAPLNVTFTISASDPDGSIQSWSVDVDNNGVVEFSGAGNPPATLQYSYQNIGTYTANLTVTDNEGGTSYGHDVVVVAGPLIKILINEMEQNPPGPDAGYEWVELYNPNAFSVNLSGFRLQTTVVPVKIHYLGPTSVIPAGGYLVVTFNLLFITDLEESVILIDNMNREIDRTAALNDDGDTSETWQRIPNGYDTDQTSDWLKMGATKGTENIP